MWISLENLDICFYVSSDNYFQKLFSFPNFLMSLSLNSWKFVRKISKLKRYDVNDFALVFYIVNDVSISGDTFILAKNRKLYQKISTNCI